MALVEQGARTVALEKAVNADGLIPIQMDKFLHVFHTNKLALVKLMSKVGLRRSVGEPKYTLQELVRPDDQVKMQADIDGVTDPVTITLASADEVNQIRVGDALKVMDANSEYLVVTAITPAGPTITCSRAAFGTSIAATTTAPYLYILGQARDEGMSSGLGTAVTYNPSVRDNYIEVLEMPVNLTRIASIAETYFTNYPNPRRLRQFLASQDLWTTIEKRFWFGKPGEFAPGSNENPSGTNNMYTTGGFFHWADTNISSGAFSYASLVSWMETVTLEQEDTGSLVLFTGPDFFTKLTTTVESSIRLGPAERRYGLQIDTLITPHGTFPLIRHPLFKLGLAKTIAAVNIKNVGRVNLRGIPETFLKENVQLKATEMQQDQYMAYIGFDFILPRTHGVYSWV